jgi:hypothetical protein
VPSCRFFSKNLFTLIFSTLHKQIHTFKLGSANKLKNLFKVLFKVDKLVMELRTRRDANARELASLLDVPQSTISRLLAAAGDRATAVPISHAGPGQQPATFPQGFLG